MTTQWRGGEADGNIPHTTISRVLVFLLVLSCKVGVLRQLMVIDTTPGITVSVDLLYLSTLVGQPQFIEMGSTDAKEFPRDR